MEESFIGDDLRLYSKDTILHRFAKKNGFQRVIFYDNVNQLHTYDRESVELSKVIRNSSITDNSLSSNLTQMSY